MDQKDIQKQKRAAHIEQFHQNRAKYSKGGAL